MLASVNILEKNLDIKLDSYKEKAETIFLNDEEIKIREEEIKANKARTEKIKKLLFCENTTVVNFEK